MGKVTLGGLRKRLVVRITFFIALVSVLLLTGLSGALFVYQVHSIGSDLQSISERIDENLQRRAGGLKTSSRLALNDYRNRAHVVRAFLAARPQPTNNEWEALLNALEVNSAYLITAQGVISASDTVQDVGKSYQEVPELAGAGQVLSGTQDFYLDIDSYKTSQQSTVIVLLEDGSAAAFTIKDDDMAFYEDFYSVSNYFYTLPNVEVRSFYALDAQSGAVLGATENVGGTVDIEGGVTALQNCIAAPHVIQVNGTLQITAAAQTGDVVVGCSYRLWTVVADLVPAILGAGVLLVLTGVLVCAYLYRLVDRLVIKDIEATSQAIARFVSGEDVSVPLQTQSKEAAVLRNHVGRLFGAIGVSSSRLTSIMDELGPEVEAYEFYPDLDRLYCSDGLLSLLDSTEAELRRAVEKEYEDAQRHPEQFGVRLEEVRTLTCGKTVRVRHIALGSVSYGMVEDITDSVLKEGRLLRAVRAAEELSGTDELTGLANRRGLREVFKQSARVGDVLFIMDLDNFKAVNDTEGHREGDRLLQLLGHVLATHLGEDSPVARLGGDEFAALMRGPIDESVVYEAADKVLQAVRRALRHAYKHYGLSLSIGGAYLEDDACTFDAVYQRADKAMYLAKRQGKDRFVLAGGAGFDVEVFEPSLKTLRLALQRGEFEVWYQPQCRLSTGEIFGAEALCRWRQPDGEIKTPASFMRAIERHGLALDLDLAQLEAVCRQVQKWRQSGAFLGSVSVNLSRTYLYGEQVVEEMTAMIAEYGLSSKDICFEITEGSSFVEDEDVEQTAARLHARGLSVLLDDFGAGKSSLAAVARMPIDAIKLDRSLTEGIGTPRGETVLSHALSLARDLGIQVIAEGIETKAQAEWLLAAGCDLVQGFYFALPVPASELSTLRAKPQGANAWKERGSLE